MGGLGATGLPTGSAVSLPKGVDPVQYLVGQVNRFMGPFAPADVKFEMAVDQYPIPEPGNLELGPALLAVLINQKRAADAFTATGGAGGDALQHADQGFADPVGWVKANINELNAALTLYGDLHHAPAAQGVPGAGGLSSLVSTFGILSSPVVLIAGVVAVYFFTRKGR